MDLSFLQNKKVLVTGGSGFVGRNFVETLIKSGIHPRITVHNKLSQFSPDLVDAVQVDLTTTEGCNIACKGIDYIIHVGGSVSNAGSVRSNLIGTIVNSLTMTAKLLEAASSQCERFLIFSSGTSSYPAYDYPVKEEDMWTAPPAPVYFGYGWMRRYFEILGEYVSTVSSLQVVICRPTATYGRYDDSGHVIPALVHRALSGETPYVVWGTGEEQRDFLHVTDLVRGCLLLLEKGVAGDPVNIGYGTPVTVKEIAKTVMKVVGRPESDIVFDSSKPTTIPVRSVDCSKAEKLLGFKPTVSLEAGLRDFVEWIKKN